MGHEPQFGSRYFKQTGYPVHFHKNHPLNKEKERGKVNQLDVGNEKDLLVFFIPHIELVYLAFFLLFSIFKVSLCTHASVPDVFCVLVRWIHH